METEILTEQEVKTLREMEICLICKKEFVRPLSHCWQKHGMSAREYKENFGLDVKKGIATKEYKDKMRNLLKPQSIQAVIIGGKKSRFIKGVSNNYKRSEQTLKRLKDRWKNVSNLKGRMIKVEKIIINCALCKKQKLIYPRYYQKDNNFCGVKCRNINNNK